ncbi:PTS sugar transporter subunit IIA [Dolosigranulum pigrum]|uniref:PTS sugar transporter subunit IIA n=1 Tax=Dolosigranulum pigrum TaxID=29394 RepID=UPI000DC4728B|nr:hypothetical protein [Dolosigranulum pigrum]QTJ54011.1 hypothetical protein FE333_07890 [Dolosigranulum pigrum]RAN51013.1 hypothetical protein B8A31_07070 [Dolosigranulum pigrum]
MINVIVSSHGDFCIEILKSAEMILGELDNCIKSVPLHHGEDLDVMKEKISKEIQEGIFEKTLILTDLQGGTPNNAALEILLENENIFLICGFNFSLLIEILSQINDPKITNKLQDITENSKQSIMYLNEKI